VRELCLLEKMDQAADMWRYFGTGTMDAPAADMWRSSGTDTMDTPAADIWRYSGADTMDAPAAHVWWYADIYTLDSPTAGRICDTIRSLQLILDRCPGESHQVASREHLLARDSLDAHVGQRVASSCRASIWVLEVRSVSHIAHRICIPCTALRRVRR
jgi:hypothetical protein